MRARHGLQHGTLPSVRAVHDQRHASALADHHTKPARFGGNPKSLGNSDVPGNPLQMTRVDLEVSGPQSVSCAEHPVPQYAMAIISRCSLNAVRSATA